MAKQEIMPGYDEEERYFHERDRELLMKKRRELDAARAKQQEAIKHAHWMKCPKCGADLQEIEMDRVLVDRCPSCEGLFFDKGELELVIEIHKGGFLPRLKKLMKG